MIGDYCQKVESFAADDQSPIAEFEQEACLVRFRFRAAVLVGNFIFLEQLSHFLGHHLVVILNGDQGDLFS